MSLLRLDKVSVHYGSRVLLDGVELTLEAGDRIGLLGRNGEGKSTLLKILAGLMDPDDGARWLRPGVEVAWLDQELPEAGPQSVYDFVAGGLPEIGTLLQRYHQLLEAGDQSDLDALYDVQSELEARDGWRLQQRVETVMSQLELPADKSMDSLSGGWRRRVALARALVREPEVLLLDEPTNHLDIPAIEWLEQVLGDFRGALILVTHDRAFLQNVAKQIIELDRGQLHAWQGDYQSFLRYREQQLVAEDRANKLFDKKLAEEEQWIRQGIKARRTRNEGRVRSLVAMREERRGRREQQGRADFSLEQADRSGKLVAELKEVSFSYGDERIVSGFSTTVMRGERIGLVGVNGAGKSTLLKILLGKIEPQQGEVKRGTNLEVAYFDQLRQQLDAKLDLMDNVCGGREFIEINGKRRHAISYLGDFLFSPDRARTPFGALSGGEQNRAILAKLFSKPANLLVLDEPTNDLDVETLELLEEILMDFKGTVLLVSHDREFLDRVVTSIMVLSGKGRVEEFVGGYSDWVARGGSLVVSKEPGGGASVSSGTEASTGSAELDKGSTGGQVTVAARRLSYKEQRELGELPKRIEEAEAQLRELESQSTQAEFYQGDHLQVAAVLKQLGEVQVGLEQLYERWSELES